MGIRDENLIAEGAWTMSEVNIPMEELIKSGEVKGREALEFLSATGKYTFHGSPYRIDILEPHQARSGGEPDGEPAVATTPNVDSAIFRAIIHRRKDEAAGRPHNSAWSGTRGGMRYMTLKSSIEALTPDEEGYVYAFVTADHQFFAWKGELRSLQPLKPDVTVTVHQSDLPPFITFETGEELEAYHQKLRNS
jgi:hypothetical protein